MKAVELQLICWCQGASAAFHGAGWKHAVAAVCFHPSLSLSLSCLSLSLSLSSKQNKQGKKKKRQPHMRARQEPCCQLSGFGLCCVCFWAACVQRLIWKSRSDALQHAAAPRSPSSASGPPTSPGWPQTRSAHCEYPENPFVKFFFIKLQYID